ncbi:MAG: hypothetical protein ACO1PB_15690 [Ramlibacter sp.]
MNWKSAVAATVAALALFALAASEHLERACTVMDTPYLPLCEAAPMESAAVREQLRQRIAGNPGDAWAWTQLLVAEGDTADEVAAGAAAVAPNHPNVIRWRASRALADGEHAKAVDLLVQMVSTRPAADAARVLARIAVTPEGTALLRPHLAQAERWLPKVLAQLAVLKIPAGASLPLVAAALEAGTLPEDTRRAYMRTLKTSGQWLDAYGLWLAYQKEQVPLLYNASFDLPLDADGFDWEFTPVVRSLAGVAVSQASVARRGSVLQLEFTGRKFKPAVLWQYVFAPAGAYRLTGEYAARLRSEARLAWKVACSSGDNQVLGSSADLQDTAGAWSRFQVDFTVPPQCGPMVTIQLTAGAAHEAAAGMRGDLSLDAFSLTRAVR